MTNEQETRKIHSTTLTNEEIENYIDSLMSIARNRGNNGCIVSIRELPNEIKEKYEIQRKVKIFPLHTDKFLFIW